MSKLLTHILILFIPLTPTLILHMLVVKKNWFSSWCIPIATHTFGKNKTWRGVLFVPLANGFFCLLLGIFLQRNLLYFLGVGIALGLAYIVAELPNSYMKRSLNIPPGGRHPKYPFLFLLIDKADSITGVLLMYYFLADITLSESMYIFILAMGLHLAVSTLLFKLKIKSSI
ncbi:CDP-archaeol synthase [Ascidiimonas sp. W6]|uniref:CDP-archaeol synthase n=1 Tax=Ascidiimonas meishanensis TaxID=3128903 RepID=UPI0030EF2623